MGKSIVSAFLISHQCLFLDFPIEAAIRSAAGFCEYIYINDGKSYDGTLDLLYSLQREYGKGRIKIFERDWEHTRKYWAEQKNFLIDKIHNDHYVFCLDADEVIHEKDISTLITLILADYNAISFPFIHFYGRPTHYIIGSSWYKRHTRLWKKSTGIRLLHKGGCCADDVVWPDKYPAHLGRCFNSEVPIYHYGNCRNPKAMGIKSKKADDLYQNSKDYINGSLPENRSFDYGFENLKLNEFKHSHPKYIESWYEKHKNQPTKYRVEDEKYNKLWCFKEK